jgi:hypothetical protein
MRLFGVDCHYKIRISIESGIRNHFYYPIVTFQIPASAAILDTFFMTASGCRQVCRSAIPPLP